ncbi:hypothetical protein [Bacillus mycoides]|uniref:hypothetical protein n=1 Tax=Bacillus mycoides TaxID=1405 RepID=UPI0025A28CCB|nr:hypothetical protein [Bacillus mycoides]MDM5428405.1 hypothetical protein [Bacillus mycoides]
MGKVFIDEKGPQETIRIPKKYRDDRRINLGDDLMRSYVADVLYIPEGSLENVNKKYLELVGNYRKGQKNKVEKELKGIDILQGNFNFGIASMKEVNSKFYFNLFNILLDADVSNLLFSVNKMSMVVDARLTQWILQLEAKRFIDSAILFKYSLTKYCELEASEEVIKNLFDPEKTINEILYSIQKDIKKFVSKHKNNNRMRRQLPYYQKMIKDIGKGKQLANDIAFEKVSFDWDKVSSDVDLWLSENRLKEIWQPEQSTLILDQGIPSKPFETIGFGDLMVDQDSKEFVGLQLADMLVVITGGYISKLTSAIRYDKTEPEKPKHLGAEWFVLKEHQFDLILKMTQFLFGNDHIYSVIGDTYFDETLMFEIYCRYISSFSNYENYRKKHSDLHIQDMYKCFDTAINEKWKLAVQNELITRNVYGDYITGIKEGVIRKL